MKFPTSSAAYFTGFRDGYNGVMNREVPNFNKEYEWGFIAGGMERKRISVLSYESFLTGSSHILEKLKAANIQ